MIMYNYILSEQNTLYIYTASHVHFVDLLVLKTFFLKTIHCFGYVTVSTKKKLPE